MSNTTKKHIVDRIAQNSQITKKDSLTTINEFIVCITDYLKKGEVIELRNFGTFKTKKTKSRPARNPKTGEVVFLKSDFKPVFKYSTKIKDFFRNMKSGHYNS